MVTYEFYKENIGKLRKEVRSKFKYFGMKLKYEEEQALNRQTGISSWAKAKFPRSARGQIINKLWESA